ncbi:uncharacterized protein LOC129592977 [Paramacrobiotus metropolitanus]|uniref:uncharacterized protein LOC129592977 n=1 Tax=Paramacrobiotus metropolitanus TaxID=2943436 RepID=UPI0024459AAD|nr:uncharacterized protein LOC129592977 [Paramacrobiotus metropolitanus]
MAKSGLPTKWESRDVDTRDPKGETKRRMSQEDYREMQQLRTQGEKKRLEEWDMQQLHTQNERRRLEELVTGKPVQRSQNPVPVFNEAEYKKTLADMKDPRNSPPEDKPSNYGEKVPLQKLPSGGFVMKRNERSSDLAQNEQKGRSYEVVQAQRNNAVERSPTKSEGMTSQTEWTRINNEATQKVNDWMTGNDRKMVVYERSPEELKDSEEEELTLAERITREVLEKLRDKSKDKRKEMTLYQTITEVTKGHSAYTSPDGQKCNTGKVTSAESKVRNKTREFYDVRTKVPHRIDKLSEILKDHGTSTKGQIIPDMDPGPVSLIPVKCTIRNLKIQNGRLPKRIEANTHEVKVGDIKVTAMLDTGAETSLISKPFCEKNGLHMLPLPPDRLVRINGISGTSGFVVTHYCTAPVTLRRKTSEHSFYVRPKCDDVQVLLGFDFLEKKFVLIDNEGEEEKEDDQKPVVKVQVGKVTELVKTDKRLIPVPEPQGTKPKELSVFEQMKMIQQEIENTLKRSVLSQKGREKVIPVPEAPRMTEVQQKGVKAQQEEIPVPEAPEKGNGKESGEKVIPVPEALGTENERSPTLEEIAAIQKEAVVAAKESLVPGLEWSKPIPVPEAPGVKSVKVRKTKKMEVPLEILKRITEEEQMFASEIRGKAIEQLKGHQKKTAPEVIEISSDEESVIIIEREHSATKRKDVKVKPPTDRILTPEERAGSCHHGYYEDPRRIQPQGECTKCSRVASQDDLSEWPKCNAAIADLKGHVPKEVRSILRTVSMCNPHIERYHWNRYRTWLSCVRNFIYGRGKWLHYWEKCADKGIQDPHEVLLSKRKLEIETEEMNEEIKLWEDARIELFWDFRINHMYKGQGKTITFRSGLGTPVYESVEQFCKALHHDDADIFEAYWKKFEDEIPKFDVKEMRELQVTRKRREVGFMIKKKVTFAPDPDGVEYPERGGDTWCMYETIPSDDWITEELMANCVFVGPKRPKGYETVQKDKADEESAKEADKEKLPTEAAEQESSATEERSPNAFEMAQMLTDRGAMWKKFQEEVERLSNGLQIPVPEAKNEERSLDNGEECLPVGQTKRSLMSLEEIDELEGSKQNEERSNLDETKRSSAKIRVARSHPRIAARYGKKTKETGKPLLKNLKAKKLSDLQENESDLSSGDEGVDERPLERLDKGQVTAQEGRSSDSDSEWTSSSDNSTTSEDSGVNDLSEQEDLLDLDEDDEVDEEKEQDIKVRRVKIQRTRLDKGVIRVYSDQQIKLKPSICTRVKIKMGRYAPASTKLMFTPVLQAETEVQPLAGVTEHRGKFFELVIANHSSKRLTVKKNQLLGYVVPYEHMESVKVNTGTVKNVLDDPEVDDITKAELTKIIGNLKLGPDLTEEQKNDVYNAFWEFWKVLPTSKKPYGDVKGITHVIDTGDARPVKCNPARTSWTGREFITKHIEEMLAQDVIEPSDADWSFPVVLAAKKNGDGTMGTRFCVNYIMLNKLTKKNNYPLPNPDELLDACAGNKYYGKMDLQSGFWQIPMDPDSINKTTFVTQDGMFRFKRMPFGVCNGPATFQLCMDKVLSKAKRKGCVFGYIDDVIFAGKTWEIFMQNMRNVLQSLVEAGFTIKPTKCEFGMKEMGFLGHILSEDGIRMDPEKVTAVSEFKRPQTERQLRSFLGLANYYRKFIMGYVQKTCHLYELLRQDKQVKKDWNKVHEDEFNSLKQLLCEGPVLAKFDPAKPTVIECDASKEGIGAVLSQDGHPIAYASRVLHGAERSYGVTEWECLAVVFAVRKFKPFIDYAEFTVRTDHQALTNLLRSETNKVGMNPRLTRWAMALQGHQFKIEYKPGKYCDNADALSRAPIEGPTCQEEEFDEIPNFEDYKKEFDTKEPAIEIGQLFLQMVEQREKRLKVSSATAKESADNGVNMNRVKSWLPTDSDLKVTGLGAESEAQNGKVTGLGASVEKQDDLWETDKVVQALNECPIKLLRFPKQMKKRYKPLPRCKVIRDWNELSTATVRIVNLQGDEEEEDDSNLQLRNKQLKDPHLAMIIDELEHLPDAETRSKFEVHYQLWNGILYRVKDKNGKLERSYVVPLSMRRAIIHALHDEKAAGHLGFEKTLSAIRLRYYWDRMSTDVKNYILACQGCQFRKTPRKCPPGKLQEIKVGHPFFRVYADLKGPLLPTKNRGYKYIAVFIDQLTKYVIAVPMKTATAKEFAKVFVKHVILVHGAPHILHTDRGRHFTAEVLTKATNVFKIKHTFGTAYHPEGQGQVERQMQTIADGLAQYLKAGNERKFNKYLPYVISAMNRAVHATTGYSAFYMLHGREMTMPEDVVTKTNVPDDYGTPDEWVETMKKNLTFAEEVAKCNIKDAYERNAEIYNKKKSEPNFKVGDRVLIRLPKDTKQGKKENQSDFKSKYDKVWKILSFPRANEAEVIEQNPKKEADLKVVSIDRLKPWHPPLPVEIAKRTSQKDLELPFPEPGSEVAEHAPQNESFFEPPLLPEMDATDTTQNPNKPKKKRGRPRKEDKDFETAVTKKLNAEAGNLADKNEVPERPPKRDSDQPLFEPRPATIEESDLLKDKSNVDVIADRISHNFFEPRTGTDNVLTKTRAEEMETVKMKADQLGRDIAKAIEEQKVKQKKKRPTPTELLTQKGEFEDAADKELFDRITKGRKDINPKIRLTGVYDIKNGSWEGVKVIRRKPANRYRFRW